MKSGKRKLLLSSLLLTTFSLISCSDFPDVHPHVLDTDLDECRQYKVVDKSNFTIEFEKAWPQNHCNGYYAFSQEDMAKLKKYFLDKKEGNK